MSELLSLLGAIQSNGGLLALVAAGLVMLRQHRREFIHHAHDKEGRIYIKMEGGERG